MAEHVANKVSLLPSPGILHTVVRGYSASPRNVRATIQVPTDNIFAASIHLPVLRKRRSVLPRDGERGALCRALRNDAVWVRGPLSSGECTVR
jgi:hypothetical protein